MDLFTVNATLSVIKCEARNQPVSGHALLKSVTFSPAYSLDNLLQLFLYSVILLKSLLVPFAFHALA